MTLRINGEVPFPQMGKGRFFCFTLRDIAELEQTYGIGEFFFTIEANLAQNSGTTALECLRIGLKERGPDDKRRRVEIDPDDDFPPVQEMFKPIMDALSLATAGKTHDELIEDTKRELENLKARNGTLAKGAESDDEDPLPESAVSSDTRR